MGLRDLYLNSQTGGKIKKPESVFEKLSAMYDGGKSSDIEMLLTGTITSMEENKQDELPEYIALINELASFYRGVSRLDEASDAYVKALDTLKAFHREDTADYSDLLMNHAGLLRSTGKHARSAELFLDAVKLLEARQPRDDKALAGALANLSLSYQAAEDLKKAYKYEKKAYDLISGGAGGEIELAEALSRLAALKYRMTEYDAAEKFASEAIELFDKIKDQSPQRSAVYATLAAVKYHKDDYAASREAYENAARAAKSFLGGSAEYVSAVSNLSTVCETLGDKKAALDAAKTAYKALRALSGGGELETEYRERIKRLKSRR